MGQYIQQAARINFTDGAKCMNMNSFITVFPNIASFHTAFNLLLKLTDLGNSMNMAAVY